MICEWCGEDVKFPCLSAGTSEACKERFDNFSDLPNEIYANDSPEDPYHYNHWAIEPIEFIMENTLGFAEGNVIKYVMRHASKNGAEDLRKAKQYIDFILKYQYGEW